jgi:hypothetical protein
LKVPTRGAGQKLNCPKCGQRLIVPTPPQPENRTILGKLLPESASPLPQWMGQPSATVPKAVRTAKDEDTPHSGLGIASFLIAMLVGGLDLILLLVVALNIATAESDNEVRLNFFSAGISLICLNLASVPACLVGIGMAIVALIAHRRRNHLFTILGLSFNGVVVLGLILLYVLGAFLKTQERPPSRWGFGCGSSSVASAKCPHFLRAPFHFQVD